MSRLTKCSVIMVCLIMFAFGCATTGGLRQRENYPDAASREEKGRVMRQAAIAQVKSLQVLLASAMCKAALEKTRSRVETENCPKDVRAMWKNASSRTAALCETMKKASPEDMEDSDILALIDWMVAECQAITSSCEQINWLLDALRTKGVELFNARDATEMNISETSSRVELLQNCPADAKQMLEEVDGLCELVNSIWEPVNPDETETQKLLELMDQTLETFESINNLCAAINDMLDHNMREDAARYLIEAP